MFFVEIVEQDYSSIQPSPRFQPWDKESSVTDSNYLAVYIHAPLFTLVLYSASAATAEDRLLNP